MSSNIHTYVHYTCDLPAAVTNCVCTKAVRGISSSTKLISTTHNEMDSAASVSIMLDVDIPISATVDKLKQLYSQLSHNMM